MPVRAKKESTKKKPVKVVAVVTPDGIEGTFSTEPRRPLIAHLRVQAKDLDFGTEEAVEPEPYDEGGGDVFLTEHEPVVQQKKDDIKEVDATGVAPISCFTRSNLMVQFKESSERKMLPESTDVACFWCVHPFTTRPHVIPEREIAGVYNVYGNFCCPQCAMSYLLGENVDPHVRWERIALLQRIYDSDAKKRIHPAPARESLKVFGGPMSIETFRATVNAGLVRVDMHMPPMVSILGSIDTKPIDFFDTSAKNTIVGAVLDKSQEEGLRLRRSKPLKDRESTLDTVMNIQIAPRVSRLVV